MVKRIAVWRVALVACGLVVGSVSLALLAMPSSAVAQSAEELRAELDTLRKENAALRERYRLSRENAAMHKRLVQQAAPAREPAPAPYVAPRQAQAADLPVKAPLPAPIVVGPSWAGFYFGGGVSREQRKTTQGDVLVTSSPTPSVNPTMTRDLTLQQYASAGHILGGWLFQYDRIIVGVEGDYYFGGRTSKDPRYLVPENCSAGTISTGNIGCGSGAAFGSFATRGHIRGIAGWEFTPRFMGFVAGGLAVGELGAGGIQVGGIIVEGANPPGASSITSTYGRRMLYGASWGGGVQAKLNESLVGRLEYLRDQYDGPSQLSRSAGGTSGGSSVTATSRPQDIKIVNQALRASLIYRFDPNASFYEAAQRDLNQFWGSTNAFAGFYVGVGLSQNNYDYRMPTATTLSINDTATPGIEVNEIRDSFLQGSENGKNVLLGYRLQAGRLLIGAEREFVRGSRKNLAKSQGALGFADSGRDFTCYEEVSPNIVCIGLDTTRATVETRGRFRGVAGVELTPSLMGFAGYGRAYGRVSGINGSSQGIVSTPGGSLEGVATVTRRQSNDISGHTWGGGFEFKATDSLIFRADYWRDTYTWHAIPVGGAGFSGTSGTVTVNGFNTARNIIKIKNEAFQASVVYQFWNPQASGVTAGGVSPLLAFAQADTGYSWTGFYTGAHAGWGWSKQGWTDVFPNATRDRGDFDADDWLAGAQIGYNYQINQFVLGIEADGNFTAIKGSRLNALHNPAAPAPNTPLFVNLAVEGLVTAAGRLGWAWNNVLLYGKGGVAFVRNHLQYTNAAAGNAHEWKRGWMAGGGAEYGITPSISAKLEYNYMDFGTQRYHLIDSDDLVDLKQNVHVVKVGLNWRFWNPGPLVARY